MRNIKLIVVAISILVSTIAISATGHPSATTNADNKLGKQVFEDNCVVCHANGNNTVEPAKTLKADALKANGFAGAEDVKKRVLEGKGVMPTFKETLKASEIEAVANYVWTQAQSNAWK
ncbi:MAG: c-type cytochrome [Blastocatellia bacterium]